MFKIENVITYYNKKIYASPSNVNKDLSHKAKDLDHKAKAKVKDLNHKAKGLKNGL